jgi:hypothetical protein
MKYIFIFVFLILLKKGFSIKTIVVLREKYVFDRFFRLKSLSFPVENCRRNCLDFRISEKLEIMAPPGPPKNI